MQVISLLPVVAVLEFTFSFSKKHDQRHHLNAAMDQVLLSKLKKIDSTKQCTKQYHFKQFECKDKEDRTNVCMFISLEKGLHMLKKCRSKIQVKSEIEVILR